MTISVTGASVDTGAPAQVLRVAAPPAISAAGNNDAATLARQQLVRAVPATALVAAYSANIAPQPKPALRNTISIPSSSLAAQFIAQDEHITDDDLAIFIAPKTTPQVPVEEENDNDFLKDLRIARGDFSQAGKATAAQAAQTQVREAVQNTKQAIANASETSLRSGISQIAASLPALLTQFIRRPNIIQARGVAAYQLAEERNAATRKTKLAEAN